MPPRGDAGRAAASQPAELGTQLVVVHHEQRSGHAQRPRGQAAAPTAESIHLSPPEGELQVATQTILPPGVSCNRKLTTLGAWPASPSPISSARWPTPSSCSAMLGRC